MIEVRPVREDEHEAVGALTLAAYDRVGTIGAAYRQDVRDVAGRLDDETTVLVAVDGGEVLGAVTVVSGCSRHFEHAGHGDGGFRMLAVAPEVQGRGVGSALVEATLDHARAAGWNRLVITSMEWMPTAHGMYARRGFVRRPDLDIRFSSGVGHVFALDLTPDAASLFPPPGPVPAEPRLFDPTVGRTSC